MGRMSAGPARPRRPGHPGPLPRRRPPGALSLNRDLLKLSDSLRPDVLTAVKAFADALTSWLDAPLSPGPEADLYQWLAAIAGQPAPPAPTQGDLAALQVGLSPHGWSS